MLYYIPVCSFLLCSIFSVYLSLFSDSIFLKLFCFLPWLLYLQFLLFFPYLFSFLSPFLVTSSFPFFAVRFLSVDGSKNCARKTCLCPCQSSSTTINRSDFQLTYRSCRNLATTNLHSLCTCGTVFFLLQSIFSDKVTRFFSVGISKRSKVVYPWVELQPPWHQLGRPYS